MRSSRSSTRSASTSTCRGLGYLNLVAWLIPGMLGVAYRRHFSTGRAALCSVRDARREPCADVGGPLRASLVGIETQQLKNMTPPSLLLAGHAIMMCAFAIAAAPAIARWAQRPRVWWLTAIGNSGAMTLYLWHIPLLLGMHLVCDYLGYPRYDPSGFRLHRAHRPAVADHGGTRQGGVLALRPLENNPLPLWDGGRSRRARAARPSAHCCVSRVRRPWRRSAGA